MANIRVGDLVRFLNMTGGGVIRKVLPSSQMVYVEDESGFEIPVLLNEVVVVEEGATIVPKSSLDKQKPSAPPAPIKPKVATTITRKRGTDPEGEQLNIHFCVLVEEGGKVGQAAYEVYLINESNYDLMVLYTSGRGAAQQTRFAGIVEFDAAELLETFMPDDIMEHTRNTIEIVAFKEGRVPFRPKPALTVDLKIDGSKFFKENAFVPNDFFDDPAIFYTIVSEDEPLQRKALEPSALRKEMLAKKVEEPIRSQRLVTPSVRKRAQDEPEVIDLHIEELLDTTAGLTSTDILKYQLKTVREVMERYQRPRFKGKSIIFIHGKGEGVLRNEILKLLHRYYPKCETQDASFQEYGFGATKVIIH